MKYHFTVIDISIMSHWFCCRTMERENDSRLLLQARPVSKQANLFVIEITGKISGVGIKIVIEIIITMKETASLYRIYK